MSESPVPAIGRNFVRLVRDGKSCVAWIGDDPQAGLMATAASQVVALFDLASKLRVYGWTCDRDFQMSDFEPTVDRSGVLLYRVVVGSRPDMDHWAAQVVERGFFWDAQFGHEPWRALVAVAVMMVEREVTVRAQEVA